MLRKPAVSALAFAAALVCGATVSALLMSTPASGQVTANATRTLFLPRGNTSFAPTSVAWHPGFGRYYASDLGLPLSSGFVFDAAGTLLQKQTPINIDARAWTYNTNTGTLEVATFNAKGGGAGRGLILPGLTAAGALTGGTSTLLAALPGLASEQTMPAYDAAADVFYSRALGGTVNVVSRATGALLSTITLDLAAAGRPVLTESALGFDPASRWLIVVSPDPDNHAYVFDLGGAYVGSSLLDIKVRKTYGMGYANGQLFVFDDARHGWQGYLIGGLPPPSACLLIAAPASLPAGGGSVTLTATCAAGGPPTSFVWSGGFAQGASAGQISGEVATTTTFTVIACNGRGCAPATTTVAVAPTLNYQGLWWKAPAGSEAGWGINFAHQGGTLFATWFTYDAAGKPWWLIGLLSQTGPNVFSGPVSTVTGPPFGVEPFDPAVVAETLVGSMTVTFADAAAGTLAYTVNGISQTKEIVPQEFDTRPTCEWGGETDPTLAANFQDLWWNAPSGSESGWGINLTHQGDTIFATWFTYDATGKPWWLLALLDKVAPNVYAGPVSTATGPPFNAVPFDPAGVVESVAGSMTLAFADGNHGTMQYTVGAITQTKSITRQIFAAPGTTCR